MKEHEVNVCENALKAYVQKVMGWEAAFVPEYAERQGTEAIITAMDASKDQTVDGKIAAGAHALADGLAKAGYGGNVTPAQCREASRVVLVALTQLRPAVPNPAKA